jgi:hypothetical protein
MGRVSLACLGVAAVVATTGPALAGASTPPPPRTVLENFGCQRSSDSLNRSISVTAVMRPVSGTERMAMKFELLRKRPHSPTWVEVSSPNPTDLGKWTHPTKPPTLGQRPGDRWTVITPVVNLAAPSAYRFRVSFRWLGSGGHVLGTVVMLSKLCEQR